MFITTQTPGYSIRWEFTRLRTAKMLVEVVAIHTETGEQSTVCTMNGLVGECPQYIKVDDMANSWTIPTVKLECFKVWARNLPATWLEKWLDDDRHAGAWSEEHIELENIT